MSYKDRTDYFNEIILDRILDSQESDSLEIAEKYIANIEFFYTNYRNLKRVISKCAKKGDTWLHIFKFLWAYCAQDSKAWELRKDLRCIAIENDNLALYKIVFDESVGLGNYNIRSTLRNLPETSVKIKTFVQGFLNPNEPEPLQYYGQYVILSVQDRRDMSQAPRQYLFEQVSR